MVWQKLNIILQNLDSELKDIVVLLRDLKTEALSLVLGTVVNLIQTVAERLEQDMHSGQIKIIVSNMLEVANGY